MVTWCNGAIVEELTLDVNERGLALGDGVFETIYVRDSKPIWLNEHLSRLKLAAEELGINYPTDKLNQGLIETLANSQKSDEVLRITLTRGPTLRGLAKACESPSLIISLGTFSPPKQNCTLATSKIKRSQNSPACRLKTLSYIDNILAARTASLTADDALILTTEGYVSGSTVANLFIISDKHLITPSLDQAILPGITRQKIIQLGFSCEERPIAPHELIMAEAVFLCNSLRLAYSVSSIDGNSCGKVDISYINQALERTF